jgi:hypothetical protein
MAVAGEADCGRYVARGIGPRATIGMSAEWFRRFLCVVRHDDPRLWRPGLAARWMPSG